MDTTFLNYDILKTQIGVDFDFCVVTGLDTNVMGIQDAKTKASIIEANGMTANEIVQEIKSRLNQ